MPVLAILLGLASSALWVQQPAPAGPAAAQTEGTEKRLCKLEGKTINAVTGEPVRKVKLVLTVRGPDTNAKSATSDAGGRFTFDDVEPGTYHLAAEKPGFLHQEYGSRRDQWQGTPLTFLPGQVIKDLEFKLIPQSVIAGKVLDEDGEPVRAWVNVLKRSSSAGKPRMMPMQGEISNDLGEFRVSGLAPGRYYLQADPQGGFMLQGSSGARKEKPEEALVDTFYPGTTDPSAAVALDVGPGQELAGMNITLRKARVYRVEGKVIPSSPAQSLRNIHLMLSPRSRDEMVVFGSGGGGLVKPDGSFEIRNVQPGSYYITAMQRFDGRPQSAGGIAVDVADGDVSGVVLHLTEPLVVNGTVRVEGSQKINVDGGHVTLRPAEAGGAPFGYRSATINADGTFKIEGVAPDKYTLNIYGAPDTLYLKSVRMGSQEVLEKGLDLSQAQSSAAIELVFGARPASVEGVVRQDEKPVQGATVQLMPDPPKAGLDFLIKSANTDQNGRFSLKGVAPGDYKLYAWMIPLEYDQRDDPDALKPYEQKAVKISVREDSREQVELTPISE